MGLNVTSSSEIINETSEKSHRPQVADCFRAYRNSALNSAIYYVLH